MRSKTAVKCKCGKITFH